MGERVHRARCSILGLVVCFCVGLGAPGFARADSLPIRNLSLEIQILNLDPLVIPTTVGAGGTVVEGTRTPAAISSLELPVSLFEGTDIEVPVVGIPVIATIGAFEVASGPGSFAVVGGELEGTLALNGELEACLDFVEPGDCPFFGPFLTWDLGVVGFGGSDSATQGALGATLVGAPWTTGEAVVGAESRSGSVTDAGDGFLAVELVTPISFATSFDPPNDVIPAFGFLAFEVPEPGSSTLGLFALGTVLGLRALRPR